MEAQEKLDGAELRCSRMARMLVDWEEGPLFSYCNFPGPGSSPLFSLLPGYRGHPSFQSLVNKLRSQVMSMARPQLSHTILTEKNW